MEKKHLIITITLMVTIIIDVMGMGLIFPVMPSLFSTDSHAIVSPELSTSWRHFYYGLAMAVWPMGLFFGSPYLGGLSDKIGRKNVILVCLFGVLLTNFLAAIAIHEKALLFFIIVRFISGFFSGSFPIAQAMMIDISDPHNKSRNISMVTLAGSSGFVIGPLITSVSTLPAMQALFDYTVPFYVAGLASLINLFCAWRFLPNTPASSHHEGSISLFKGFSVIYQVFSDKRTQKLMIACMLLFLGWGFYCINLALLVQNVFGYSTSMTALLFAFTAISNILGITLLQPMMLQAFSLKKCCFITALLLAGLLVLSANTHWAGMQWIVGILAPGIQMVFYTAIMTMFSNSVSPTEQGKVMGGADAGFSIAWMANSLAIGFLVDIHILLPLVVGAICVLASSFFFKS